MFFIESGGRLTDNRSSCVIMQELRKKQNLKQEDSLGLRKFITSPKGQETYIQDYKNFVYKFTNPK